MSQLAESRKSKERLFKTNPQSPLTAEHKGSFQRLIYFPENPALRFELPLERHPKPDRVRMQTSTGDEQDYFRIGKVRFKVSGQEAELHVYRPEDGGAYFIPFVDTTAPNETYGAGRYLEPEDVGPDRLLVDFNYAYNPYCAYNERWSCPIPPAENRLKVRIEAGEKNYHD